MEVGKQTLVCARTQTLVCADIGPWERGTSQAIGSVTAATDIGPRLQSRGVGARKGNE